MKTNDSEDTFSQNYVFELCYFWKNTLPLALIIFGCFSGNKYSKIILISCEIFVEKWKMSFLFSMYYFLFLDKLLTRKWRRPRRGIHREGRRRHKHRQFFCFIYLILIFFIYIYIFNFSLVWVGGLDSLCFSFLLNVFKKSSFLWKSLSFSLYYLFNSFLENLKLSP